MLDVQASIDRKGGLQAGAVMIARPAGLERAIVEVVARPAGLEMIIMKAVAMNGGHANAEVITRPAGLEIIADRKAGRASLTGLDRRDNT